MRYQKQIAILFFVLNSVLVHAQDFPYQYFSLFNPIINNPSFAAFDSDVRVDAGMYNLWAGGYKPLSDYVVSFSLSPDFKRQKRSSGYDTRIGLGGVFLKEKIGPFTHGIYQLLYAYHIPVNKNTYLSLGICGSVETMAIDINSLAPLQSSDPRLIAGDNNSVLIDGGFGAAFHGENYIISLSALNLASGDFTFKNSTSEKISNYRKFHFAANCNLEINHNVRFQPAVALRNSMIKTFNFDSSVAFEIKTFSIGAGYRSENSVFVFTRIPYKDFYFTYHSENPLGSNHMIGNGHTFTFGWRFASNLR